MENPITPPSNLVEAWYASADNPDEDVIKGVAVRAARWGADQELEACCGWIESNLELGVHIIPEARAKFRYQASDQLRATRRSKPPSLKEQALESLDQVVECLKMLVPGASVDGVYIETLRRALESLPNP